MSGFFSPSFFAEGGYVGSPTAAIIGETGEGEAVIPNSKVDKAMRNYRPGSGAKGLAAAMDGPDGGSADGAPTYNFQTTQFMDREWVDKDQLIAAMNQAAKQGAAGGKTQTLGALRNSRSTRSRLGMN